MELPQSSSAITETSQRVAARLIEYASNCYVAFPPHTTYGLIESPSFVVVPGAARYGYGLLAWQGKQLPLLLDLYTLLQIDTRVDTTVVPSYALILAYQRAATLPLEYGAIGLALPAMKQNATCLAIACCGRYSHYRALNTKAM